MASLSWSNTRITVLEYCQKKYFLNYYSDWLRNKYPELWKETKILKRLKSFDMRMWEMTHKTLSMYLFELKNHILDVWAKPDKDKIIEEISQNMEKTFNISKNNNYSEFIEFGLSEHFYEKIDDNDLNTVVQKVVNNLNSFVESEYHNKIEQRFRKWHHIYIEDPHRPNFEMMKVNVQYVKWLEDVSILANPDFWIMFGDDTYLILDWKSGKEKLDNDWITDQLRVYALKVLLKQKNTKLDNRKIEVYEVYLPSLTEKAWSIKQEDIDWIIEKIKEDIEFQKQFLFDQDTKKNEALNHSAFARTNSEKKCANCTFRNVCQKLKNIENENN